MGVVSARDENSAMAFIRQFKLEKYFDVVVTSQSCRHTKPFPDPLLFAAEKLGVEPQFCLMVGDTTVDIKAAKLAGMQAVGVLCGFGRRGELERAGADLIVDSSVDLSILFSSGSD
jgi:phosphoglycolate phosphatase-like HAD superfamily hydrolase